MISALRFYEMFNAMTLHFKSGTSYDFFKYGGKTRVNENSFLATKGKYFYEKHARKFHSEEAAIAFLAANFKIGTRWVTDLKQEPYDEFISYRDALFYRFERDLEKYTVDITPYNESLSGSKDSWNYLILINEASNGLVFQEYDKKYKDDIMWEELKSNITKFYPFVVHCFSIDDEVKRKLRTIVKKLRSQTA